MTPSLKKNHPAGFDLCSGRIQTRFTYSVEFEVYPEVELQGLEAIEVEKPIVEVTDADVDGMLDTLRKQQATWKEKDGAVEAEDRVTIDFTGSVDGEEFEGGKASDFVLAMGGVV